MTEPWNIGRVIIEAVSPEISGARFPLKRLLGERVEVEADIFADGHDLIRAELQFRHDQEPAWRLAPMKQIGNDRWRGHFRVADPRVHRYRIAAWIDAFGSWRRGLEKFMAAGAPLAAELLIGAGLARSAAGRADRAGDAADRDRLLAHAALLGDAALGEDERTGHAASEPLLSLMRAHLDRSRQTVYDAGQRVEVDPKLAGFGAWYEMFPRSAALGEARHGTFRDCEAWLPYVASMGFDVLYLPPVHPIGARFRKGPNNSLVSASDDVGCPWAIGAKEGGHTAIHPALGTLDDFRRLVARAREHGLEIAMDLAFQCSPDHHWARERPDWFTLRPDGTIQCAENPPKLYQDIYPLDFECAARGELWRELKAVAQFWLDQGVRIFRVDNPHTKPIPFWDWLIAEIRRERPDVIFLAEAFTRPKVMARLAKGGFTQSYTYFAWRRGKEELVAYMRELTRGPMAEYFRPNFWPNTPDILTDQLQSGSPAMFRLRLILAATLSANYGIYGPAFELMESRPVEPGTEEYLNSEKYEIRRWDLNAPHSLRDLIALVNRIRRENPALHSNRGLEFHGVNNDQILLYSKRDEAGDNVILVAVNLDPARVQLGWTDLWMEELGLGRDEPFLAHDLLSGERFAWRGPKNYIELNPARSPAHILRIEPIARTERDFETYT